MRNIMKLLAHWLVNVKVGHDLCYTLQYFYQCIDFFATVSTVIVAYNIYSEKRNNEGLAKTLLSYMIMTPIALQQRGDQYTL